jgi:cyclopropane fatty-acyl-phospholipid synthase-like methyltransferase
MLKAYQDAFGHAMYAYYSTGMKHPNINEIVEREDGYIETSGGPAAYFKEYRDWPPEEKKALRYARGRVLDIGCGAGRHSLYLQEKGLEVVGMDNSPLAIEVCRQRGLGHAETISLNQISSGLGVFDTVLMLGNNFGLFGSYQGARRYLKKISRITSKNGRIIAATTDIYDTDNPEHLRYHEMNRKRSRMAGQIRLRVRYRQYVTPWFDYLMVSRKEMEDILKETDWKISRIIESGGPVYIAIIEKKK